MNYPTVTPEFRDAVQGYSPLPDMEYEDGAEAELIIRFLGEVETHATAILRKVVHVVGYRRAHWILLRATVEHFQSGDELARSHTPGGLFLRLAKKMDYLSPEEKRAAFKKGKKSPV